jgi:type IV secretory pathway VirB2 component (pilin)
MAPLSVRLFWWLSLIVVVYWVSTAALFFLHPSASYLLALAHIPLNEQQRLVRSRIFATAFPTIVWGVVTIGLAWLAASKRMDWARWLYALQFVGREVISIFEAASGPIGKARVFYQMSQLSHWIEPVLTLAAIALVFSGNARTWFKRHPSESSGSGAPEDPQGVGRNSPLR